MRFKCFLLRSFCFCLLLLLCHSSLCVAQVFKNSLSWDGSGVGSSRLSHFNQETNHQGAYSGTLVFNHREKLLNDSWFWNIGARTDAFVFDNRENFPIQHFQSYAVPITIEYVVASRTVSYLMLRPGFYFESKATANSWDIPLDFVTGVPIRDNLNGVLGVSYARFYDTPLPVFGVEWRITRNVKLLVVYPEPSLDFHIKEGLDGRVHGDLVSGGFRSDSLATPVEYFEYRVGAGLTKKLKSGIDCFGEAGYAIFRTFNLFEQERRIKAVPAPYLHIGLQWSY